MKHNLALIGYGGMGNQHLKLLSTVERMNIAGIYDIDNKKNEDALQKGYHVYSSLEDVLKDKDVDIILIATPNHVHKEIAIKSMQAGKNVICEKPVTLNSEELVEILEVEKQTGKIFVVHQNRRWDEDFRIMKQLYDNKELGEIFDIEARIYGSRGIPGDWRKEKQYGGGMLLDWGVHLIDRLLWMTKEPIKKIYCEESYVQKEDCDDGFKLLITFVSGCKALLEVGTCNYIYMPKWYMCGTTGSAIVHDWDMNGSITRLKSFKDKDAKPIEAGAGLTKTMAPRDEKTVDYLPIPRGNFDVREFYENVMNTIEGKESQIVKNEEVMRVMKVIEAARLSSETNQAILFEAGQEL